VTRKPSTSKHEVIGDKLKIEVRFKHRSQADSRRIGWISDLATAGSAAFLHMRNPGHQWVEMERDPNTGSSTVSSPGSIPLAGGASRIDLFSNHGNVANDDQQQPSSPYTQVDLSPK
jgi:hypothetical protein